MILLIKICCARIAYIFAFFFTLHLCLVLWNSKLFLTKDSVGCIYAYFELDFKQGDLSYEFFLSHLKCKWVFILLEQVRAFPTIVSQMMSASGTAGRHLMSENDKRIKRKISIKVKQWRHIHTQRWDTYWLRYWLSFTTLTDGVGVDDCAVFKVCEDLL